MFSDIQITNFGPFESLGWAPDAGVNTIIGVNGTGKSLLLKLLYVLVRSYEEFQRGNDKRTFNQVFDDKLWWTFQSPKVGDLVSKKHKNCKIFSCLDKKDLNITFSSSAEKGVGSYVGTESIHRNALSAFLPAKEILSIHHIIRKSRDVDKQFGFDDTYLDLINMLDTPPSSSTQAPFSKARRLLGELVQGKLDRLKSGEWRFKMGNQVFPVALYAEGLRRIAILERLLGNRTLTRESLLFVDEPEAGLHPEAITQLVEMLWGLSQNGMQIFLSTHSYFVLKKLQLLAQQHRASAPVLSLEPDGYAVDDLRDGMPDNPIVQTSIDLYRQELQLEA